METTTATEADVPAAFRAAAAQPVPAQPSGTAAANPLPLHWFQKDAVAAAVREVKDGGRATVVAATGSGKTLIAAGCARRLAARGRVLVLVPTIELLEQTAEAWSLRGGRRGLAVAACSREEALESAEAGGRVHAQVTTQTRASRTCSSRRSPANRSPFTPPTHRWSASSRPTRAGDWPSGTS
ncbi:DEAD/DEAH box helicase family protein [Kitasatospora sp. NPDC089797]|uniref:DEAD/DEAH box helicase n=1 Tax=Kitasatospora sp. NPDC089797 TaxID=3155298 RepID=UPI003434CBFC